MKAIDVFSKGDSAKKNKMFRQVTKKRLEEKAEKQSITPAELKKQIRTRGEGYWKSAKQNSDYKGGYKR